MCWTQIQSEEGKYVFVLKKEKEKKVWCPIYCKEK